PGRLATEPFHLDHIGAHVAHHHGRVRAGHEPGKVQHLDAAQRAGVVRGHSGTLAWPTTTSCPSAFLVARRKPVKRAPPAFTSSSTTAWLCSVVPTRMGETKESASCAPRYIRSPKWSSNKLVWCAPHNNPCATGAG